MYRSRANTSPGLAALLILPLLITPVSSAWTYSYCSKQNTAGDFSVLNDDWQSNGWCHDRCKERGNYAFAVIRYKDCWCSDYIPADQSDVSDCSETCPGFPSEKCGNEDEGLYLYLKLDGTPSGTAGGSKPTASPSLASSSSSTIRTSSETETIVGTVTSSFVITTSISSSKSSSSSQTSTATSDPPAPVTPQTTIKTVTEGGAVITQTIVTTSTNAPLDTTQKSSTNTGAIVGGVVGGVVGLAAIVGGVFFFLWRRRRQQRGGDDGEPGVQRHVSTMSKSGLLRTEKDPKYPSPIATSFDKRQSRALDQDSISPVSGSDRRNSTFRIDQRLNPSSLFVFDNGSRGSVGSLDETRDYHRTLNVRNPDAN